MNKENIAFIMQKFPGWFDNHVSCNMFHDYTTSQLNQYPVFTIKNYPLFKPLGVPEVIQSNLTSYSEDFISHFSHQIENYIVDVCEKALSDKNKDKQIN